MRKEKLKQTILEQINNEIDIQKKNYILNVNISDYSNCLFEKYKFIPVILSLEEAYVTESEADISAHLISKKYSYNGKTVRRKV